MSISEVNLARKWRPATFESIIGQDLTVRILKNSLFRQQFFPVYLLAGQRGCGKTTTGRILAAALNCHKLSDFSKDPRTTIIPCGCCASCDAMRQGNHPDFIEIDAASHTGVDHVRQIIEAASFLPQLGQKKIYLIDEAHMLSKAAFNAFLKILEEPPKTVVFMMATTDAHKIIDTVRSRCFQLFFDPVSHDVLEGYLKEMCMQEEIPFEDEGLKLVIHESEGSVRDALNIIERVRLAHDGVSRQAVVATFGFVEDELLMKLLEAIAACNVQELVQLLEANNFVAQSAHAMWKKLFEWLRNCIVAQYGIKLAVADVFQEFFVRIGASLSVDYVITCMEIMYAAEQQFMKTTAPHALLEMLLIKMCMGNRKDIASSFDLAPDYAKGSTGRQDERIKQNFPQQNLIAHKNLFHKENLTVDKNVIDISNNLNHYSDHLAREQKFHSEDAGTERLWLQFVTHVDTLGQPLFASMVKQGRYMFADESGTRWHVALPKELGFFQDTIEKAAPAWRKLVEQLCQKSIDIVFQFTGEKQTQSGDAKAPLDKLPALSAAKMPLNRQPVVSDDLKRSRRIEQKPSLDVRDPEKWQKTHALLALFPGTVSEVK